MVRSREDTKRREALVAAVWRDSKKHEDAYDPNDDGRQILGSLPSQLGVELSNRPLNVDGKPFYASIYPKERGKETTYEGLRERVAGGGGAGHFLSEEQFDSAVAQAFGTEELTPEIQAQMLKQAHGQAGFQGSIRNVGINATEEALRNVGGMLAGDGAMPDVVWQAMNLTEDKLRAKWGNAAADGLKAEVSAKLTAGDVAGAAELIGMAEADVRNVIKPEVNTVASASEPTKKDMPPWGQFAAIGGAGAVAGGLAYHLLAQGQQQANSADYAAVMQSLAAY